MFLRFVLCFFVLPQDASSAIDPIDCACVVPLVNSHKWIDAYHVDAQYERLITNVHPTANDMYHVSIHYPYQFAHIICTSKNGIQLWGVMLWPIKLCPSSFISHVADELFSIRKESTQNGACVSVEWNECGRGDRVTAMKYGMWIIWWHIFFFFSVFWFYVKMQSFWCCTL